MAHEFNYYITANDDVWKLAGHACTQSLILSSCVVFHLHILVYDIVYQYISDVNALLKHLQDSETKKKSPRETKEVTDAMTETIYDELKDIWSDVPKNPTSAQLSAWIDQRISSSKEDTVCCHMPSVMISCQLPAVSCHLSTDFHFSHRNSQHIFQVPVRMLKMKVQHSFLLLFDL